MVRSGQITRVTAATILLSLLHSPAGPASGSEDDVREAIIAALREADTWRSYFVDGYEPSDEDVIIGDDVAIFAGDERVWIAPITVGDVHD